MTRQIIPNEELITALKVISRKGVADYFDAAYPNSEKIVKAADLLQAQAERIKELETVPMKYRRMQFNAELQEENARLRAQIAQGVKELVGALENLARLGNGEHYGNSDGNMIARAALSKYKWVK